MVTQRVFSSGRLLLQRAISFLVFGLVVVSVLCAPAEAAGKRVYAGIVVDAKSGKTLYSRSADAARYPASVTKVMTLYVLFQELDAGNMKLSTKMRVSKHAAAAVPTKLGLRPGSTISVESAIKSLVTLSANDISRVIAEHISGTESQFAVRMTKVAKSLGMSSTTYRNASGLPDSRQITTVRDQARLGIAVYQHFPKYYKYFQIKSFKYGKRTYGNHNRLLGQNGVDGIKTGYIRAAGYNLLTAARKNGRHIVVVGFGFDTSGSRNAAVAKLIARHLPKARKGDYVRQARISKPGVAAGRIWVAAVPVTPRPRPANRGLPAPTLADALVPAPQVATRLAVLEQPAQSPSLALNPAPEPRPVDLLQASATAEQAATLVAASGQPVNAPNPRPRPIDVIGAWISESLSLPPARSAANPPLPPVSIGGGDAATIDLMTSGATGQNVADSNAEKWAVQVGTSHTEDGARILISDVTGKISGLADYRPFVQQIKKNGQTLYRARFAGFGSRDNARQICGKMKEQKMGCLAVRS